MDLRPEDVSLYLRSNPTFLENYVCSSSITRQTFERWVHRRTTMRNRRQGSITKVESSINIGTAWNPEDIGKCRSFLAENASQQINLMYELAVICAQECTSAEAVELVVHNEEDGNSYRVTKEENEIRLKKMKKIKKSYSAASYVLQVFDCNEIKEVHLADIYFFGSNFNDKDVRLANIFGATFGSIFYFGKRSGKDKIKNGNESSMSTSSSQDSNELIEKNRKLTKFLLEVVKSIFQEVASMDTLIIKIMNFAQRLVDADRASLFLVDTRSKELYARIFDVGVQSDEVESLENQGQKEIRFPIGKGIAGTVAQTGKGLNIPDAYKDERFNPDVDHKTGYQTKNILCMPIFIRTTVIGVVQMVNKHTGEFTKEDSEAFETFAIYCGLALHHAKLYDKIRKEEQKYRVALEVLTYHSSCNKDEIAKVKKFQESVEDIPTDMLTFNFNSMTLSELEKPVFAIKMFQKLFGGRIRFDGDDLIRFTLTVRKNYRKVPYHNWQHGFTVAQSLFILLNSTNIFKPHEALAMYIAAICHDLDHRGKNNAYMKTMSTPLASIYSTSVMEHHHFNQTITILQQEGHNILRHLNTEEYKEALGLIKHCILATDLALFFPNKDKLNAIVDNGKFDWNNDNCRSLSQAIIMTACDLIAAAKPWHVQSETVKVIFEEFYEQGDAEKMNGREPIAMMDREKAGELPKMQVGFMRGICIPCYDLIAKIIPECKPLKENATYNATKWEELAEEYKKKQDGGE
uniref:Phosphodiesterase n=1 Tax=Parastrongyloides trichosuri TaxID=131310 RepID=A0A0N4ZF26_PARTI